MDKHLLYGLNIQEISSVDKGAGEGVEVLLMKNFPELEKEVIQYLKRSFSTDERDKLANSGAALPDGSFPIENKGDLKNAIRAIGRASNPEKAKAHIKTRAQALDASDLIPDDWKDDVDKKLVITHDKDGAVKIVHTPEPGEKTIDKADSFAARWLEKLGFKKSVDAMRKSAASIMADPTVTDKDSALAKSAEQFVDHINKTAADAFAATVATVPFSSGEVDMTKEEIEKAVADAVAKAVAPLQAVIQKLETENGVLKLDDDEKKYAEKKKMKEDDMAKFVKLSKADRKKVMDDDEDVKDTEKEDLKKRLAVLEHRDTLSTFTKRATDLGLPETYGEVLMKAHSGDTTAVAKLEAEIKALHTQVEKAGLFSELGRVGKGIDGTAYDALVAKGAELRKAKPELTDAQAFAKAYEDPANRELVQKYKDETSRRAA